MIPVIMFHFGRHGFVRTTLEQAQKQNSKVILLGDEQNKGYFDVEHHCFKDYAKRAEELRSYYIFMITDPPEMNIFYTQRYLMLLEFMEAHGYDRVFTCDSDIMVHCDVEREAERLGKYTAAFDIPKTQSYARIVAMGNGYWTRQALKAFSEFVREAYAEGKWLDRMKRMWQWHLDTGHPGGVSDMTLLKMFSEVHPGIVNLSEVRDGAAFDHALSTGENWLLDEYRTVSYRGWTIKDIEWREGVPYIYNLLLKRWIRFCTLHYCGARKSMLVGNQAHSGRG